MPPQEFPPGLLLRFDRQIKRIVIKRASRIVHILLALIINRPFREADMTDFNHTSVVVQTKVCIICGSVYKKSKTVSKTVWGKSRYCSLKCINTGRAPGNKGKKTGKPSWNTGKECPETSGPKNGSWKGGIDHKTCRRIVLKRDDFTCQSCGMREPDIMQVDHIKSKALFPELKYDTNNLETLCPNCHARKTVRQLREGISHAGRSKKSVIIVTEVS